jgi:AraC-like DNA-binding protein
MKLYIKNMICTRCKMVVQYELKKLGLHFTKVEIGSAEIKEDVTPEQWNQLNEALKISGLELMVDKKSVLIEKIKNVIIELVNCSDEELKINLSDYLREKLNHDYTYLANVFSVVQGTTIEKFFISSKIARVKEMLVYDELQLTEIAYKLHYSSVAHLSNQFKKMTGLSPSQYKQIHSIFKQQPSRKTSLDYADAS